MLTLPQDATDLTPASPHSMTAPHLYMGSQTSLSSSWNTVGNHLAIPSFNYGLERTEVPGPYQPTSRSFDSSVSLQENLNGDAVADAVEDDSDGWSEDEPESAVPGSIVAVYDD
jgi:hypothetical protein